MIILGRRKTLLLFGILSAGLAPFLFVSFPQAPVGIAFLPVVIAAEFLIYVLFSMISAPDSGWSGASFVAMVLAGLRFLLCLLGAYLLAFSANHTFSSALQLIYIGNPLSILLQMLLILTLAPHLLAPLFPRLLSAEALESISEHEPNQSEADRPAGALPVGGYVQVYSYDELTDFLRKIVGLEGFLFYSDEGLALFGHFPFSLDQEAAAVASNRMIETTQSWIGKLHLQRSDCVLVETLDRFIVNAAVLSRIRFIAFFTKSTPVEIVLNRVELIRRTAGEFLRSRGERQKTARASAKD